MNRISMALIVSVLPAIVACNDADDPITIQGVDDDSSVLLKSVGSEVLSDDGPGLDVGSDDAGFSTIVHTPTPTKTSQPTVTAAPESLMPSKDTHLLDAMFSNGTADCGLIPEFTLPFEAEIDGENLTLRSLEESFSYTGVISSDGIFEVMDDDGFERWEGEFSQDWSVKATNSFTEAGCTTIWDVSFMPSG